MEDTSQAGLVNDQPAPKADGKLLLLPNGKEYLFGPPSFSRQLARFISLSRRAVGKNELSSDDLLEFLEVCWYVAEQSMINGGHTPEEVDEAFESIPFTTEWLEKIRDALGLT